MRHGNLLHSVPLLLLFSAPPVFEDVVTKPAARQRVDDAIKAAGIRVGSNASRGAALLATGSAKGNRGDPGSSTSQHRGVCFSKANSKWIAQRTIRGKNVYVGAFDSEDDAAKAFDAVSWRLDGM